MLVDSHCHLDLLDLAPYDGDLDAALDAARASGVGHFLCIGVNLDDFPRVLGIARQHEDVACSIGVHPLYKSDPEPTLEALCERAANFEVVAIGETGLDFFYRQIAPEVQQQRFRTHLAAARETGLPLIIHSRDAKEETLAMIREHGDQEHGGVLHCFTGDLDMALRAIDLNYYISISGIVTFRNAGELRDVVRQLPLERLLVETDSPWLAPVPHRGKKNEPRYVADVAACVADLLEVSVDDVARVTTASYQRLFGFPGPN